MSCTSGSGAIGGDSQNDNPWHAALQSAERDMSRAANLMLEALRLEEEADRAEALGKTELAISLREDASAVRVEVEQLEKNARKSQQEALAARGEAQARVDTLNAEIARLNNEQRALPDQLTQALTAQERSLAAFKTRLEQVSALHAQIKHAYWRVQMHRAYTDGANSRRSNWRVGAGVSAQGSATLPVLSARHDLRYLGWFADWSVATGSYLERNVDFGGILAGYSNNTPSHTQIAEQVRGLIASNPEGFSTNTFFMVGNENNFDDARTPTEYALTHCAVYEGVKSVNPDIMISSGATLPNVWYYYDENSLVQPWHKLTQAEQTAYRNFVSGRTGEDLIQARINAYNSLAGAAQAAEIARINAKEHDSFYAYTGKRHDFFGPHTRRELNKMSGVEYWRRVHQAFQRADAATSCGRLRALGHAFLPIDAYNIHLYPGHDTSSQSDDMERVKDSLLAFRGALAEWGHSDRPLIAKEVGPGFQSKVDPMGQQVGPADANWPSFNVKEMDAMMRLFSSATHASLGMPSDDRHMIQRWAWFVMTDGEEQFEGLWDDVALFDHDTRNVKVQPLCKVIVPGQPCRNDPEPNVVRPLAEVYRERALDLSYFPKPKAYELVTSDGPVGLSQIFSGFNTGGVQGRVLEFYSRVNCSANAKVVFIATHAENGTWTQQHKMSSAAACDSQWHNMHWTYQVPERASHVRFWFELRNATPGTGTARLVVDDVKAEAFAKPIAERSLGARGQQLVRNGGFETGAMFAAATQQAQQPAPWSVIIPNGVHVQSAKLVSWW